MNGIKVNTLSKDLSQIASGGPEVQDKARKNLRTVGELTNANQNLISSVNVWLLTTTLTARRTKFLPLASEAGFGGTIIISSNPNTITEDNWLTISRSGSDVIGSALNEVDIPVAGTSIIFTSDGISRWTHSALPTYKRIFLTSNLNWRIPFGYSRAWVALHGAGGGGASGRRGAINTACGGGGGGGSGTYKEFWADRELMGNALSIEIGAGGLGGAPILTDDTNGANGVGGSSNTLLRFFGFSTSTVTRILADGGGGGVAGTTAAGAGSGTSGGWGRYHTNSLAGAGGVGNAPNRANSLSAVNPLDGGGGGGGIAADNTLGAGSAGRPYAFGAYQQNINIATPAFSAGVDGSSTGDYNKWASGSGGSVAADSSGRKGGDASPGFGGGGGSASRNGSPSGAGGRGGDGWLLIVFYS